MNCLTVVANLAQILSLAALVPLACNAIAGRRARRQLAALQGELIAMPMVGEGVIADAEAHPRGVEIEPGSCREDGARLGMQIGVLQGKWWKNRLYVWLA